MTWTCYTRLSTGADRKRWNQLTAGLRSSEARHANLTRIGGRQLDLDPWRIVLELPLTDGLDDGYACDLCGHADFHRAGTHMLLRLGTCGPTLSAFLCPACTSPRS